MRKKCTCCDIEKNIQEFYKKKNGLYGRHAECKKCMREKNKEYRDQNSEKIRIKDSIYREKIKNLYSKSCERSHIRMSERSVIGFEKYAERKMKLLAGSLLNYALRVNLITKPSSCMMCHKEKELQGHHNDYSKPLQVIWVCIDCHASFHTGKLREING